jgi:hypothetical protein
MIVYLAGGESGIHYYGWRPRPASHIFLSFFQRETMMESCFEKILPTHPELIVMDSGAHSFFGQIGKSVTKHIRPVGKMPEPDKFFNDYFDYLVSRAADIHYAVELDIGEIVGMEKVREWRRRLEDSAMAGKMIWVYHSAEPESEFDRIIHECPSHYVGIEGIRPGQQRLPYPRMIRKAMDVGTRVHGFAMTKRDTLLRYPFFSVDSSTWTYSVRSGKGVIYNPKSISVQLIRLTPQAMARRGYILEPAFNRSESKAKAVGQRWFEMGEEAFRKMERDLTQVWESRGVFWR